MLYRDKKKRLIISPVKQTALENKIDKIWQPEKLDHDFMEKINDEIEGSLLTSLRGYTLNSWYNHWTSILIEDLFKDHDSVLSWAITSFGIPRNSTM